MSELALELISKEKKEKTGKLDLGRCGLTNIPKELFDLVWLEEINFCNTRWDNYGNTNIVSPNNKSNNQIQDYELPREFIKLTNLRTFYFGGDLNRRWKLKKIDVLGNLKNLQSLNLSYNRFSDISELENLNRLQILNLSDNRITNYSSLKNIPSLVTLDLSDNRISSSDFLEELTNLKFLDLRSCQFSDYGVLSKFKKLQNLYLSFNQISDYSFLKDLLQLKTLDISNSSSFSSDISFLQKLTQLQTLNISSNHILNGDHLENLTQLKYLDARGNLFQNINFLKKLRKLEVLHLKNPRISDFSILEKLTQLRTLNLSGNNISNINFLKKLTQLEYLDISNNKISDLSFLMPLIRAKNSSAQSRLKKLNINKNPLSKPPMKIVEKGTEAVINWFEQIDEQGVKPFYEAKLMILGQGGAGKTTFANLQLDSSYRVHPGKKDSTLGIVVHKGKVFKHQSIQKQQIKAHLWDFGGQDIQKMLHQFFITENCLYILVSDKRAENTNFDYWFQIISLLGPKSSVIVLENPKNIKSANEDFAKNKYIELFKELDIESIEVDLVATRGKAKNKWKALNNIILEKLSILEIVNRPVPRKWTLIRDELDQQRKNKYITKDKFYEIAAKEVIGLSSEQADLCLFYLRELGDLAYYDDKDLCTYIFLDHNWLTQGMYYVLSDKKIQQDIGQFTRKQAYAKWDTSGYKEEEKAILLRLLLKDQFDICYELPHKKDVFITPLLLPNDKPEIWKRETNVRFRYFYGFMPHGMFSRLIVRINEKIDHEQRWKSGVRLIDEFEEKKIFAEVQQYIDPDENQMVIDIKVNGSKKGCKELLLFVRRSIEDLHKEYKNIRSNRKVACNCDTCVSLMKKGQKPSFYDFEKLQSKIENRSYFEECEKSNYKRVNIGKILSDVVIEHAAKDNIDRELMHKLQDIGMSINHIKNENKIEMSDFGKSNVRQEQYNLQKQKINIKIDISIEIQTLLGETESLKEDIEDERKLLQKSIDNDEIDITIKDIEKVEKAVKEIESSPTPSPKSRNRLKRFIDDLSNEKSSIHKTLSALRKGRDYGVNLAKIYNNIAANIPGMLQVPPIALNVIEKL